MTIKDPTAAQGQSGTTLVPASKQNGIVPTVELTYIGNWRLWNLDSKTTYSFAYNSFPKRRRLHV